MSELKVVIVGSVGVDTIETPWLRRDNILGGSASYGCAASSYFSSTGMVGVVGTDFPTEYRELYEKFSINLDGLQTEEGKTFQWHGVYEENMDNRKTLRTDLNVFENFNPQLPEQYCDVPYVFLGNIAPQLQLSVLDQVKNPKFVLVDTMDLWIDIAQDALKEVISRVTMLTLNESEARLLTDKRNLPEAAAELLAMGPEYVLIKKGENGSMLFSKSGSLFMIPAFPVSSVVDPTGAGDTFAGGFIGYLATQGEVSEEAIRRAMVYGGIVASFGVEDFSLDRLEKLQKEQLEERASGFIDMVHIPWAG